VRKLAIGVVVLIVLILVTRLLIDRLADARLARIEAQWRADIQARREAAVVRRMPVLRGDPREGNAGALERAIAERLGGKAGGPPGTGGQPLDDLRRAKPGDPGTEVPAATAALLEPFRKDLDEVRDALRCARSDWQWQWENGMDAPIPNLLTMRALTNGLVVDGNVKAAAGDGAGAAACYLDAIRFGEDLAADGPLICDMMGVAMIHLGLKPLSALVTGAAPKAAAPLDEVDRALAALEAAQPRAADAIRAERLFDDSLAGATRGRSARELMSLARTMGKDDVGAGEIVLGAVIPTRAIIANAIPKLEATMEACAAAASISERARRDAAISAALDRAIHDWNPLVSFAVPNFDASSCAHDALAAHFAALRLAVRVEKRRLAEGKCPATIAEEELPVDPCAAPAKLVYAATEDGAGYTITSAGEDGKPGTKDDIVISRAAPR
jgi:hypothetical protein